MDFHFYTFCDFYGDHEVLPQLDTTSNILEKQWVRRASLPALICTCVMGVGAWCHSLPQHMTFLFRYWFHFITLYIYKKKSSLDPHTPSSLPSPSQRISSGKRFIGIASKRVCLLPTHPGVFLGHHLVTWQLYHMWKSHYWAHVANPTVTSLSLFHWTCQRCLSHVASSPFLKHFLSSLLWLI